MVIPFSFFKSESTNKFKDILSEIDLSFKPNTKFAVRSSSSQEDGGLHSFAGQFETFLNVPHKDLEDKIMSVFKSVNSDRVKTYRAINGLGNSSELAVIIKEMTSEKNLPGFSDADKF